jgi:hypothetical protein
MNAIIDPLLHDEVRPVLEGREGLLWAGRPDPPRTALANIGQSLTGAVFILLLFLVYISGLPSSGPHVSTTSMVSVIRPGIYAMVSLLVLYGLLQPVFSYRTAKRTVYAVTNKRVLSLARGRLARSVWYEDMQVPLLELGSNNRGDIHFNGRVRADGTEHRPQFTHFLGIEDAGSVYQLLLGQMPGEQRGRAGEPVVEDYLELLFQGKRSLNEDLSRE